MILVVLVIIAVHVFVTVAMRLATAIVITPPAFILGIEDPVVVFGMLQIPFGENAIPCRVSIPGQSLILLQNLLGRAADLCLGAVALERAALLIRIPTRVTARPLTSVVVVLTVFHYLRCLSV